MLAEATSNVTSNATAVWAAAGAFVSMVLVQVGKLIRDGRKDQRLMMAEMAREAREAAGESAKQKSLERIADANERALTLQGEVAVRVAQVHGAIQGQDKLATQRHEELLTAIRTKCPLLPLLGKESGERRVENGSPAAPAVLEAGAPPAKIFGASTTRHRNKSMNKIKIIIGVAAMLATITATAQTNAESTVTTITGTGVNTAVAPTNGFWGDLGALAGDVGLSSNPTNYAFGLFGGIKTSGSQYSIGAYVIENVNNYVGVMAGVDQLFGGGKLDSENVVAGGLTLKAPTHPLRFLTSSTNSFAYNLVATPYAMVLVSTPIGGTGNAGGGLGAVARSGVNVDIYNWSGWQLAAGVDYGNRTGSGTYNGNWIDGTVNVRKGF